MNSEKSFRSRLKKATNPFYTIRETKRVVMRLKEVIDSLLKGAAGRGLIYLGDYRALTRTIFGQKMFVDTRDISVGPHILMEGFWEMWITRVFRETIKKGMTVVEVGANIGYYTLLAAKQISSSGKLYAFEANPQVFDILYQNILVNGLLDRTTLVNKPVFDKTCTLKFSKLKKHLASGSVAEFSEEFLAQYRDEVERVEMDAVSLDEYFADDKSGIDVIKIDAEGSEAHIFDGMKKIIENNPQLIIICEFAPSFILGMGKDPKIFLEEITRDHGFKLRTIEMDSSLKNTTIDELLSVPHCELYLTR